MDHSPTSSPLNADTLDRHTRHQDNFSAGDAQRFADRLRAVASAASGVIRADSHESLRMILEEACRSVLSFDIFFLSTYDAETHTFHGVGGYDAGEYSPPSSVSATGTPGETVVRERRTLVTAHASDPAAKGAVLTGRGKRSESAIRTPILSGEDVLGMISVQSYTPDLYGSDDVEIVEVIASLAASALSNLRLAEERRRAESALRERERELLEAQRIAHVGTWSWPVGSPHVTWSDELYRIFGHEPGEGDLTFDDYINCIHPEDRSRVLEEIKDVTGKGGVFDFQHRVVRPDKSVRVIQGRGEVERDSTGAPVRLFGTVQDVTDRVAAEAALRLAHDKLEMHVQARTTELAERTSELARAEQRFRAIVEASPVPLLLSRAGDGTILYANDRLETLIGVPTGSLTGQKTPDYYYDPADRPNVIETVRRHGFVRDMTLRIKRTDGTPRWVSLSAQRLIYDGEPAFATSLVDITERIETEEALRASEESYRGLFDNLTELVYVQALDGRFLNVNEAVVRTYGYSREELIGQGPEILAAPGRVDLERTIEHFQRAVEGEPQRFEWWGQRKDGSIFPKEVALKRSTYFGHEVVIAVGRDISDRVEADNALRRSEEHFRRLIENASDLISIIRPDGKTTYQSPAIWRTLGYDRDEMIGVDVFEFVCPDDLPRTAEAFQKMVDNPGTSVSVEFRFRHKDGTYRYYEAVGTTLSPETASDGVVVNSRDITERRSAEAAMRESEALKRGIVEAALDCIVSIDSDGNILEFNPAAERTFGYTAEEVLGKPMADFIVPPSLRAAHHAGINRFLSTGEAHVIGKRIELPAHRKGGTEFPSELAINVVKLEDGRQVFTAYLRDISSRKEAEDALRRSEEQFRLLIENSSDVATILDANGVNLYQSPSGERVLGYKPEDVVGRSAFERIHPDDAQIVRESLRAALQNPGTTHVAEFRYLNSSGEWRVLEASGRTLRPDDASAGVIVNSRDVTERVEANRALGMQKTLLEAQGEASIDGILVVSDDGNILSYNRRFVELWHIPPDVVTSRSDEAAINAVLSQLVDPDDFARRVDYLYAHPDEEARDLISLRDGRVFDRYSAPIVSNEGEYYGRIWFFRDVTSVKRHAEELEQARQDAELARTEAESASRAKSQFLANMSHELRTPLNAIIGYAEMLVEDAEDAGLEESVVDLRKIQTAGRHLLNLINDILDLSKIEAGHTEIYIENYDLKLLLENVRGTIEPLVEEKGNSLVVDTPDDLDSMTSDPVKVRQILFNLLSNAAKFTEDGTVTLSARRVGENFVFRVMDSGIGMTQEQLDRLFQPFTQADASTTRRYGGTGLGLAITHRFTELLGGTMEVESEPNVGTTFTVQLPAHFGKPGVIRTIPNATGRTGVRRTATGPAATSGDGAGVREVHGGRREVHGGRREEHGGGREDHGGTNDGRAGTEAGRSRRPNEAPLILVIDDDPASCEVVQRMLAREGFNVTCVYNGMDGLRKAQEDQPDLITLDVLMPDASGWEILARLKADPSTTEIPVVVVTVLNDDHLGYALGASEYLTKPVDRERVVRAVQNQLGGVEGDRPILLLVEDDASTRDVLSRALEREGWRVEKAENGRVGIEALEDVRPAMVILDLLMPELDGFDFIDTLRKHPEWDSIPVVVLTALHLTEEDRQRLNHRVEKVIQKGELRRPELLAEIRRLLRAAPSSSSGNR